jgi:periplasmic protein TonB
MAEIPQTQGSGGMNETLQREEVPFISVLTFVVWTLVCTVTTIGFVVPYVRPHAPGKNDVPITAETLQVELSSDPLPVAFAEPPKTPNPPPLSQPPANLQELPTLTPVAEPSVVAFALPVEGPVQIVAAKAAAYLPPAEIAKSDALATATAPQQLVYGEGEGKQPAPEYPYRARQEGQEGVVKVRFTVGENGRVLSAEAASPSPWSMLNQSAVRVVRERWRFRPGMMRVYEVSIKFQLTR